jgi:hypothetical protein
MYALPMNTTINKEWYKRVLEGPLDPPEEGDQDPLFPPGWRPLSQGQGRDELP